MGVERFRELYRAVIGIVNSWMPFMSIIWWVYTFMNLQNYYYNLHKCPSLPKVMPTPSFISGVPRTFNMRSTSYKILNIKKLKNGKW